MQVKNFISFQRNKLLIEAFALFGMNMFFDLFIFEIKQMFDAKKKKNMKSSHRAVSTYQYQHNDYNILCRYWYLLIEN